jgi:hypothetical protein
MSRPGDLLSAVLPAVYGCYGGINAPIGFFVWEAFLGVDQFDSNWTLPYQGLLYPAAAGLGRAGTWWSPAEQSLWANWSAGGTGDASCAPAPVTNYTAVDDWDPRIDYAPAAAWTAWVGGGPRHGSLHYADTAGATAAITLTGGVQYSVVHKAGPDCGMVAVVWDGVAVGVLDTYDVSVSWGVEFDLPSVGPPSQAHTLLLNATGRANPSSTNAYVQLVGFNVYTS